MFRPGVDIAETDESVKRFGEIFLIALDIRFPYDDSIFINNRQYLLIILLNGSGNSPFGDGRRTRNSKSWIWWILGGKLGIWKSTWIRSSLKRWGDGKDQL